MVLPTQMGAVNVPDLRSYPPGDIAKIARLSPAFDHHLKLLDKLPASTSDRLRFDRHQAWCEAAIATLLKNSPAKTICAQWSQATDQILARYWNELNMSGHDLAFFALGKWGARELNLSSDIDVIFIARQTPTSEQFKLVREFIQLLSQPTQWAFAYRVDTDLKPGGRFAPIISSVKQFEDYYWSLGATWERLALVRLRAVAGPEDLVNAVYDVASHFCYRRYLDYGLLEDLKLLRSQIHFHNAEKEISNSRSVNLKLAPGGIRDIELFLHALQIIHGGRDRNVRTTSTDQAAQNLLAGRHFSSNDISFLIESYWLFREFENQLQAIDDRQTHEIFETQNPNEYAEFATRSAQVNEIVATVLGQPAKIKALPESIEEQAEWLSKLGFSIRTITDLWPNLIRVLESTAKTFKDSELRQKVLRELVEACAINALDKDLALAMVLDFVQAIRARSSLLSLLAHENKILVELSRLFGCSRYLGGVIASRPELLDGFLYRQTANSTKNSGAQSFEVQLEDLAEERLLSEIVSASQFLRSRNVNTMTASLTATADGIAQNIFNQTFKTAQVDDISILALGKWGGRELGLRSDLDFVFVTGSEIQPSHHRAARRFISRLTEQHRGGAIYNVDLRLRPSGNAGPIIVEANSLLTYLKSQAAPWERQSYLRARAVNAKSAIASRAFINEIKKVCLSHPLQKCDIHELARIRQALVKPSRPGWLDLKYCPGGLIDIEFCGQILVMQNQNAGWDGQTVGAFLPSSDQRHLRICQIYEKLRETEQLIQLVAEYSTTELAADSEIVERAARLSNESPSDYFKSICLLLTESDEILKEVDPRRRS